MKNKIIAVKRITSIFFKTVARADLVSLRHFPMWLYTQLPHKAPHEQGIPRLTLPAIDWLKKNTQGKTVFEYGSGGSTFLIGKRAKKLVSVEHHELWYNTISRELEKQGISCEYLLVKARKKKKPAIPSEEMKGYDFSNYVKSIDKYGKFDLVLIDGRARSACIKHALPHVKKGGFLMLDNSDRHRYQEAIKTLDAYERIDFVGPAPYLSNRLSHTSLWHIA